MTPSGSRLPSCAIGTLSAKSTKWNDEPAVFSRNTVVPVVTRVMRQIGITLAADGCLTIAISSAFAADRPVYKAPPPVTAYYNWTGFYVGANAGVAWGAFETRTTTVNGETFPASYFINTDAGQVAAAGVHNIKRSGFTGGFGAGYNFQARNLVFGLEGTSAHSA
jgi:outer membrane immunogenic protein